MKDKTLIIKVDEEFTKKVDCLQRINDYKNRSDTVRKVVEKEYRRSQCKEPCPLRCKTCSWYTDGRCDELKRAVNDDDYCAFGAWSIKKEEK